jgi:Tfp pilus assembly protein PilF
MAAIKRLTAAWLLLLLSACATTGTRPAMPGAEATAMTAATSEKTEAAPMDAAQQQAVDTVLEVMRAGEWQAAREMMQDLIISYPTLAVAYANMGTIQQQLGYNEQAGKSWLKALELRPGWATLCNRMGIYYREQGRFEQALAMYQQALVSDDGYAMTHRNIGILYELYLGEGAKALEHYRRYRELVGEEEKEVLLWIADLERRVKRAGG